MSSYCFELLHAATVDPIKRFEPLRASWYTGLRSCDVDPYLTGVEIPLARVCRKAFTHVASFRCAPMATTCKPMQLMFQFGPHLHTADP